MQNSRNLILVFAGILIVLVVIAITSGLNSSKKTHKNLINVSDYAQSDVAVRVTTEGSINANEDHQSSVVTIARGTRSVEFYKTYNNELAGGQSFENNQASFEQLVYALQKAGYSTQTNSQQDDERGYCPTGFRYIYEIVDGDKVIMRTWSDSCGDKDRTFGGNASLVRQLMRSQIPNYSSLSQAAFAKAQ